MGGVYGKKRKTTDKSSYKARRTKSRAKDLDQIQDEFRKHAEDEQIGATKTFVPDMDLPGLGRYTCLPCDKHFISEKVMQEHMATKAHKRRAKLMLEKPYTQKEAELAAGMAPST